MNSTYRYIQDQSVNKFLMAAMADLEAAIRKINRTELLSEEKELLIEPIQQNISDIMNFLNNRRG